MAEGEPRRACQPINSEINPNRFPIDKSFMIPGIFLHKCTLDSANLKQIGGLIKNSPGAAAAAVVLVGRARAGGVGGGKCVNNLSDLIDTTAML